MKDTLKSMISASDVPSLSEAEIDSIIDRCGSNLNLACAVGWELKAAKAASMISFTADGATFNRKEYIDNAQRMSDMYRKRLNTTIRFGGDT